MHRFEVENMGCGGCAKAVTHAVNAVEPNARVEIDLGTKHVIVSGSAGPAGLIADAIAAAGFPATQA